MTTLNVIYVDFDKYSTDEVSIMYEKVLAHMPYEAAQHTIVLPKDWEFVQYFVDDGIYSQQLNNSNKEV